MDDDKPAFVARKFQDAQKLAAKGYSCPLCSDTFPADLKLWQHAKLQHHEELGLGDIADDEGTRKQFRKRAMEKAHKHSRRVIRDPPLLESKPSSNDNDSMRPNIGEEVSSRSPISGTPAPGSTQGSGHQIDDIGKLSLAHHGTSKPPSELDRPTVLATNPLKRGALPDAGAWQSPGHSKSGPSRSRLDHGKTNSRRNIPASILNPNRSRVPVGDPDFTRDSVGGSKKLFDPETDDPFLGPAVRNSTRMDDPSTPGDQVTGPREGTKDSQAQGSLQPLTSYGDPVLGDSIPHEKVSIRDGHSVPHPSQAQDSDQDMDVDLDPVLLLQPETRPISHDQLVVEVKGIYAGLVMVESKCVDVDEKQSKAALDRDLSGQTKLKDDQWQALAHLHKTLLHEHHDFYLASQHPSASPALSELANRYSMPSRMWRHAIYAFLEVLRHRLPDSSEHMLAFIYTAYSMVALLYETVPTFEPFWLECLGDISRYRKVIQTDDSGEQDHWSRVAQMWYCKAADRKPDIGRFYNRQAIIARQYSLQQLSLYARSLTSVMPFENTRENLQVLLSSALNGKAPINPRSLSFEMVFLEIHGIVFLGLSQTDFDAVLKNIEDSVLDSYIGRVTARFKEHGVCITMTSIAALFEYNQIRHKGLSTSVFRLAYEEKHLALDEPSKTQTPEMKVFDLNSPGNSHEQLPSPPTASTSDLLTTGELRSSQSLISRASRLFFRILAIALRRPDEKNVHPLVHVSLVFLYTLLGVEKAFTYVEGDVPWDEICSFLTFLVKSDAATKKVWAEEFPTPDNGVSKPLPEDFMMRGQLYTRSFFPENWFPDAVLEDEDRMLELASVAAPRRERILWVGARMASINRWISYNDQTQAFVRLGLTN